MQEPLVSVSLVAYNAEAYIKDAIDSCLSQDVDFEYEIIIHDDASSDKTAKIIEEYAKTHPGRVIPILQSENQFSKGIEINAQIIIPRAKGKYIAFLEADDFWIDPYKLRKVIGFMEDNPNTAMCFTASKHVFPNDPGRARYKRYRQHDAICSIKDIILMGGRIVDMGTAVVRKSVFENVPEWYFLKQIWDITVPLLSYLHGNVQYLDIVTCAYRYNVPGSWTQTNVKQADRRRSNLEKSIRFYDVFNEDTNQKYSKLVERKIQSLLVEILLLSSQEYRRTTDYYSRLSAIKKMEFQLFNLIGSFRLWERYIQIKRLLTGY